MFLRHLFFAIVIQFSKDAPIAQRLEHTAYIRAVAGSSPAGRTHLYRQVPRGPLR